MVKDFAKGIFVFLENNCRQVVPPDRTVFEIVNNFIYFMFCRWIQNEIDGIIGRYEVRWTSAIFRNFII